MNNSKIALDNLEEVKPLDRKGFLEKEKGKLTQIAEALSRVEANEDWQKLKRLVLDNVVEMLEKQIVNESSKSEVSLPELYRLQGQLLWAKKYVDLKKLSDWYKYQIENIKNQLHEHNPRDGAL